MKTIDYRPISLFSHIYNLLTRLITNCLTVPLSLSTSRRSRYQKRPWHGRSSTDILNNNWNIYEIQHPTKYGFHILSDGCWSSRILVITPNHERRKNRHIFINIGDHVSSLISTVSLENYFKQLYWERKGLNIKGIFHNQFSFVAAIVLINPKQFNEELKSMQSW